MHISNYFGADISTQIGITVQCLKKRFAIHFCIQIFIRIFHNFTITKLRTESGRDSSLGLNSWPLEPSVVAAYNQPPLVTGVLPSRLTSRASMSAIMRPQKSFARW